jgi:hypothetical protein
VPDYAKFSRAGALSLQARPADGLELTLADYFGLPVEIRQFQRAWLEIPHGLRTRLGGERTLASGGELYADVTNGYGPEVFAIDGKPAAGPYQLSLHYYSQGPMGYGMGLLQIQTFDPAKGLAFDDRPYLIMTPHAKVDLGSHR